VAAEPGRGAQRVEEHLTQAPVELGTRESGLGHECEPLQGRDRTHELEVGLRRAGQHAVGRGPGTDPAAVGLQGHGGDQPRGQREPFSGGGRSVQDVLGKRVGTAVGRERQRPAGRPVTAGPLLRGLCQRIVCSVRAVPPREQPAPPADRHLAGARPVDPGQHVVPDSDLNDVRQGEQQVGGAGAGLGEQ